MQQAHSEAKTIVTGHLPERNGGIAKDVGIAVMDENIRREQFDREIRASPDERQLWRFLQHLAASRAEI